MNLSELCESVVSLAEHKSGVSVSLSHVVETLNAKTYLDFSSYLYLANSACHCTHSTGEERRDAPGMHTHAVVFKFEVFRKFLVMVPPYCCRRQQHVWLNIPCFILFVAPTRL